MKKNIISISPPMKGWAESWWWISTVSKANTSLSVGEHFMHALYYKAHWKLKAAFLKELLCNSDIWGFQSLPCLNWLWNTLSPEGSTSAVYKPSPHSSTIPALSTDSSSALGLKAQARLSWISTTMGCSSKEPAFKTQQILKGLAESGLLFSEV